MKKDENVLNPDKTYLPLSAIVIIFVAVVSITTWITTIQARGLSNEKKLSDVAEIKKLLQDVRSDVSFIKGTMFIKKENKND